MDKTHILTILYDLASTMAGEISLPALQTRVLQRLLQHSGFPAGVLFRPDGLQVDGTQTVHIEQVVGDAGLLALADRAWRIPAALCGPALGIGTDASLLDGLTSCSRRYRQFLHLTVDESHVLLLLSHRLVSSRLPLAEVFSPVLRIFSRAMAFCRQYEAARLDLIRSHVETSFDLDRFRAAVDAASESFFLLEGDPLTVVDCNASAAVVLGHPRHILPGMHFADLLAPEDLPALQAAVAALRRDAGGSHTFEASHLCSDGRRFPCEVRLSLLQQGGQPPLVIAFSLDISLRREQQARLLLANSAFQNARDGIIISDLAGCIVEVNPSFSRITGYQRHEVIGRPVSLLRSGMHERAFYKMMWKSLVQDGHWQGEIWNRRKNGETYVELLSISVVRDAEGQAVNYVAVFTDISQLRDVQDKLRRQAYYDMLTNLPNRSLLVDRLGQAMGQARRHQHKLAVCVLDLDHFKRINDQFGASHGDTLLVMVAHRLRGLVSSDDTIARLGGDEFACLLDFREGSDTLERQLSGLLDHLALPFELDERQVTVSASVGVAVYPDDDADPDTLLRHASDALHQAKISGRRRYHFFDTARDRAMQAFHDDTRRLRQALRQGELELFYQPKVNLRTRQLVGVEALIRWRCPQRGLVPPIEFLPVAEKSDLIVEIGEWTLHEALRQSSEWLEQGLEVPVSVNIAGKHLQQRDFVARIQAALARHEYLPSHCLELEILESTALEDIEHVRRIVNACQQMGVGVALDDFGTGYSSLAYLKQIPAKLIKIDQLFVRDLLKDPDDLAIVQGIMGLAQAFRRQVIAEGVETEAHCERLLSLGCDLLQGYGIARPMPASELPAWLARFRAG